jgi:non-ribosomal peptide synthetase component F
LDCDRLWGCAATPNVALTGDHVAYLVPSVDSTGATAWVEIVHDSITRLVCDSNGVRLTSDDVLPLSESLTSSGGLFGTWGALLHGGRLTIMPTGSLSCKELASFVRRRRATVLRLPAEQAQQLIDHCLEDLCSLRQLVIAADSLPASYARKLNQRYSQVQIARDYSPIDGLPAICYCRIDDAAPNVSGLSLGQPIDGVFFAVLDENGQPALYPSSGELCIGGRCLPRGFRSRPDLNAERFIPHPYEPAVRLLRTGDRVLLHDDGILEFRGRIDARSASRDRAATEAA